MNALDHLAALQQTRRQFFGRAAGGLGIARQIVDKHGGEFRCESKPGETIFEVRLPVGASTS